MANITATSQTTGRTYTCAMQHLHLLANTACVELAAVVPNLPARLLRTETVQVEVADLTSTQRAQIIAGAEALLAAAVAKFEDEEATP